MLKKIAPNIASYTSEIIGFDVIITDDQAIIIGASDKSRLGDFHEGSIRVIYSGKPSSQFNKDVKNMKGTKPGFTIPIWLSGKVIGTIGITGKREDVEKFGLLVQRLAEMMLKEELYNKTKILREQAIQNLIYEIIAFNPLKHDASLLITKGYQLGFDLKPPHISIVIDLYQFKELRQKIYSMTEEKTSPELSIQSIRFDALDVIKKFFNSYNDIATPMGTDKFIILHAVNNKYDEEEVLNNVRIKCKKIIEGLDQRGVSVAIGIGAIAKNIFELSRSYNEAWQVLEIGKKIHKKPYIYEMKDFYLENMIINVGKDISEWYIGKTLNRLLSQSDWIELSKTIREWCEAGFNKAEASKNLHIHRNTLQYRIEKIHQISGMNMQNYKDALILYLAVHMVELRQNMKTL